MKINSFAFVKNLKSIELESRCLSMQQRENYKTIQIRLPDFRNAISYPDIRESRSFRIPLISQETIARVCHRSRSDNYFFGSRKTSSEKGRGTVEIERPSGGSTWISKKQIRINSECVIIYVQKNIYLTYFLLLSYFR